jgi:uncharacterized OB-fold protein
MTEYAKPLPYPDAETKPYWDSAKRHELRMQACAECGKIRFPLVWLGAYAGYRLLDLVRFRSFADSNAGAP